MQSLLLKIAAKKCKSKNKAWLCEHIFSSFPLLLISLLIQLSKSSIFVELENLLAEMWNTSATIVSPISFLDAVWKFVPSFRGYQQQDAQEFIRYLLDR